MPLPGVDARPTAGLTPSPAPVPAARSPARFTRLTAVASAVAAAAALAIAAIVFYWPVAFGGGIFTDYDLLVYFYPYQQYLGDQIRRGSLPLWNPYLFGGVPFLANIQTAVFYPPSWIAALLDPPYATTWLTLFHTWLAAAGMSALGRGPLRLSWPGAVAAGIVFAFGGFLTQQAAHPNQLATAAWLPILILVTDRARGPQGRLWVIPGCLIVAALIFAGHSQEAYYSLLAAGVYTLWRGVNEAVGSRQWAVGESDGGVLTGLLSTRRPRIGRLITALLPTAYSRLPFLAIAVGGVSLAAVQLVPTVELSRLGIRSGGLSFDEAITFSLPPWRLAESLLPFATDQLPTQEWVGYVGVFGLGAALLGVFRGRHRLRLYFAFLAVAGLLFAFGGYDPLYGLIYRIVPGVGLFRVPARWLFWVAFGVAALAGLGVDRVPELVSLSGRRIRPRILAGGTALTAVLLALAPGPGAGLAWAGASALATLLFWRPPRRIPSNAWPALTLAAIAAELWLAGRPLTGNLVTHPQAWFSIRPAIAQVLIDPGVSRVLSVSASTFDPGDRVELGQTYRDQLGPDGPRAMFVALKLREILAPNIPLAYQRATLDGYDGGVLPLRDYVAFKNALIDAARSAEGSRVVPPDYQPDGLLVRQLSAIPPTDLLSALNVAYVVTDKTLDPWVDGVYYDLGLTERVPAGGRWQLPVQSGFEATTAGLVSYLEGAAAVPAGTVIGTIRLTGRDGRSVDRPIRAGEETAEGLRPAGDPIAHPAARVASLWVNTDRGFNYLATFDAAGPGPIARIAIDVTGPGTLVIRGLSLLDRRTGASVSVPLRPDLTVVQSGDLKVYRNAAVLPRGYLIDATADRLGAPADLPTVMRRPLAGWDPALGQADLTEYAPGSARFVVDARRPARLVFSETAYPGWEAEIDGRPAPIDRANGVFQSVTVAAGRHEVAFRFAPRSVAIGAAVSAGTAGLLIAVSLWLALAHRRRARRTA